MGKSDGRLHSKGGTCRGAGWFPRGGVQFVKMWSEVPRTGFGDGRVMRRGALTSVLMFMQSVRREWRNRQTRTVQVRVPERVWGFNSPLAHLGLSTKCPVAVTKSLRIGSLSFCGVDLRDQSVEMITRGRFQAPRSAPGVSDLLSREHSGGGGFLVEVANGAPLLGRFALVPVSWAAKRRRAVAARQCADPVHDLPGVRVGDLERQQEGCWAPVRSQRGRAQHRNH